MRNILLIFYCCVVLLGCAHYDSGYDAIGAAIGMNVKSNEEIEEEKCYDSGYLSAIDNEVSNAKKDYFLERIYKPYITDGLLPNTKTRYISRLECDLLINKGIVNRYANLESYAHQKSILDEKTREATEKLAIGKRMKKEKEEAELQKYIIAIHSISFSDT